MNTCGNCKYDVREICPCASCSEYDKWEPQEEHIDSIGIYDVVEEYPNCTIQILRNSITGEESIGWFNNDDPPVTVD